MLPQGAFVGTQSAHGPYYKTVYEIWIMFGVEIQVVALFAGMQFARVTTLYT
jgi:hypothetical protein